MASQADSGLHQISAKLGVGTAQYGSSCEKLLILKSFGTGRTDRNLGDMLLMRNHNFRVARQPSTRQDLRKARFWTALAVILQTA
jgi:hypothetical protein